MNEIQTPANQSVRSGRAFELETQLKATKMYIGTGFLEIGKILKEVRDNNYYVELGYESITEWFSSPDVCISPSWAWHFIAIYETFVLKHNIAVERLAGIDYTKLQDIIKVVEEHPELIDEWIEKARNLRRIDLKRELQELRVKTNIEEFKKLSAKTVAPQKISGKIDATYSGVYTGDPNKLMAQQADGTVDCIITTPPVVVTRAEAETRDETETFIVVDDYAQVRAYYYGMVAEFNRVLAQDRSLFLFGNLHNIFTIGDILKDAKFTILRDIIWFKRRADVHHNPFNLIKSHETILWARKGGTHVNNITDVEKDVWEIATKRVMVDRMVTIATYPKQLVFDPYMDDDTLMDHVNMLDRRFIGFKHEQNQ